MNDINTYQDKDGTYKPVIGNMSIYEGINTVNVLEAVNDNMRYQLANYGNNIGDLEYINQRYWQADANRQYIWNNEMGKYNSLINTQNRLLYRINYPEIRLWRYQNQLYYHTNNGQLIIGNEIEIQKELSSRYGCNVCIVNDINDVLQKNNEYRINTFPIAINSLPVVEEELFNPNTDFEIFQDYSSAWKRNLLAHTRYQNNKLHSLTPSFIKKLMSNLTQSNSESISLWIKEIGNTDTILLLVGNQTISEDIVVNKVIKPLFNTGIVVTLTDSMLQKESFENILRGKLILHIDHIPVDEKDREKLQQLLVAIVIQRSFFSDGRTIPTQIKVIVTIDETDSFFKNFMELTTTLFINKEEDFLSKLGISNLVLLYKEIEQSLDYYAGEISSMPKEQINLHKNDNQRYLELVSEVTTNTHLSSNNLPILDPYNENYETLFPQGDYHTLITGLTRIGKSFLMLTLMLRYIFRNDCSVILFDIHSDLAKKIIKLIKEPERLVYICPVLDSSYSPTINLFEISNKSEKNIAKLAQVILRVLKSIKMEESFSGPMEELLLNCIRILLRKGGGSFSELYRFMNDKRNKDLVEFAKGSGNLSEKEYFNDYFASATSTKDAVRRRLSTLLYDPLFSNLMNGTNTIDLEKEMNTLGKVIVFDIPKGEMENSYEYYIKFILEYVQILALKRVELPSYERVLTHLFLDEAHNFITPNGNIETILTEAGKYNLYLTMANQAVSQYKNLNFRDIILSMTDAKIIGKNSNQTLEAMNRTLNTKLDVEKLSKGEFYISVGENEIIKVQNTNRFLDEKEHISDEQLEVHKQYQLKHYYRTTQEQVLAQPTEPELDIMLDEMVAAISSADLSDSSCLKKLQISDPERFAEIESDFSYFEPKTNTKLPRIRQQELSTVFKLAFEQSHLIENRKFTEMIKDKNPMFLEAISQTRKLKDGVSKTEKYYLLSIS